MKRVCGVQPHPSAVSSACQRGHRGMAQNIRLIPLPMMRTRELAILAASGGTMPPIALDPPRGTIELVLILAEVGIVKLIVPHGSSPA